ncbi:hypothetical protein DICVIV_10397 [Dictyocaulus viviparus]|uniref:Uncharacterized protein n=1 Tax=Dictyocaulus viviparus TaxID=29172 RepID=A0A0D8XIK2_DICVI|nr:hypothetical protein DICVIV_10397 [Dictyocaulus viviparus]
MSHSSCDNVYFAMLLLSNDCWSSVLCSFFSVSVITLGVVLLVGTLGWMFNSPRLLALLIMPPIFITVAISCVIVSVWVFDSEMNFKYSLATLSSFCLIYFWIFMIYIVIVIRNYCKYLERLQSAKKRRGFNIEVFNETFFGTPPLKGFSRLETSRCSKLSDSFLDDIFGEDYESDVVLE